MKKIDFRKLNKNQLKKLRKEVKLNSLFIDDYKNSFNIDPHTVCDFFDGYLDLAYSEEPDDDMHFLDFLKKVDNIDDMYEYYLGIEWEKGNDKKYIGEY